MKPRLETVFTLWKDFTFEAAHQLKLVPPGHQCGNVHGHSYKMRVHCQGKLDPSREWVVDYAEIAAAARPLVSKFDHTFLNDWFPLESTAENLAWWCADHLSILLPSLCAVEIFETPTTSVICPV